MPAATPPEVRTLPSSMYSTSGTTLICGYASARAAQCGQCVVARRPSSRPAAASTNAPRHNDTIRAPRAAAAASASSTARSGRSRMKRATGRTTMVSATAISSSPRSTVSQRPPRVGSRPRRGPQIVKSYHRGARPRSIPNTSVTAPRSRGEVASITSAVTRWFGTNRMIVVIGATFHSGPRTSKIPARATADVARTPTHPCPASKGATVPLSQTIQFNGVSAQALYRAYLSSAQHAAMTVDGTYAATYRRRGDDVDTGAVGDELRAIGPTADNGNVQYSESARVLELVSDRLIVLSWKSKAWDLAVEPSEVTGLPSTLVLTFTANFMGAEIHLSQTNIPSYQVRIRRQARSGRSARSSTATGTSCTGIRCASTLQTP